MQGKALVIAFIAAMATLTFFSAQQSNYQSQLFEDWKKAYGVSYNPVEDAYRKIIFLQNVELINKHNADSYQTYKMGINQFTALTDQEFMETYLDTKSYKDIPKVDIV